MTLILNFSIISLLSLRGLLEMTGVLSSSNLIVLVLVLFGFITKCFSKKILLPFFGIFIIFLASGLISTLLSSTGLYNYLLYNRTVIAFLMLYFFFMMNENNISILLSVRNIFLFFLVFQILAYFVKFAVLGFSEDPAGTISAREGSATTLISLLGISYFFTLYLGKNKKLTYLVMIFLFIVLSQINEKRAVLILVPMFIFYIYANFHYKKINIFRILLTTLLPVVLLLPLWVYLIARINPFLNPDGEVWGAFDLIYLIDFIYSYAYRPDLTTYDYGRIQGIVFVIDFMLNSGLQEILLGNGAGSLPANFESVQEAVGIRYGARMGFVWVLLQHGFIGVFLLILLFYMVMKSVAVKNASLEYDTQYIFLKSFLIILAFDFFFYSSTVLYYPYFIGFFIAQYSYLYQLKKKEINNE